MVGAFPSEVHELVQEFRQHFMAATAEQPVVLFLDALDQLSEADNGRQLHWLPFGPSDPLPSHVKIVVSCLSDRDKNDPVGQPYVAFQQRKLPSENMLNLDALLLDDATTLLFDRWLRAAGRTVNEAQRRLIEDRLDSVPTCRQPLYLKLLFEEAKLWRSYDEPPGPGGSVADLLEQLCQRLSRPENHGESLVPFVLGYITAFSRVQVIDLESERVITSYDTETADLKALANGPLRFPWRIVVLFRGAITFVERCEKDANSVRYPLPVAMEKVWTHSDGHTWVGANQNQLYFFRLEGGGEDDIPRVQSMERRTAIEKRRRRLGKRCGESAKQQTRRSDLDVSTSQQTVSINLRGEDAKSLEAPNQEQKWWTREKVSYVDPGPPDFSYTCNKCKHTEIYNPVLDPPPPACPNCQYSGS